MKLGRIYSTIVETKTINTPVEGGFFEDSIYLDLTKLTRSTDPRGLINHTIARHLASAIAHTGIPKEYWFMETEPVLQREFSFPKSFSFKT